MSVRLLAVFRVIIVLLFGIIMTHSVSAQENGKKRVIVHLWNGNVISGETDLCSDPYFLKVFPSGGDSLVVPMSLIKSVYYIFEKQKKKSPAGSGIIHPKFYNSTSFGIITGSYTENSQPQASLTMEMINGFSIYRFLRIGFGMGYDVYETTTVIPFFISLDGDILDRDFTPFYFINAGSGSAWDSSTYNYRDVDGKSMFHAGIGYRVYSSRINVGFSLGYKYQNVIYTSNTWNGVMETKKDFNRISMRISVGF